MLLLNTEGEALAEVERKFITDQRAISYKLCDSEYGPLLFRDGSMTDVWAYSPLGRLSY